MTDNLDTLPEAERKVAKALRKLHKAMPQQFDFNLTALTLLNVMRMYNTVPPVKMRRIARAALDAYAAEFEKAN